MNWLLTVIFGLSTVYAPGIQPVEPQVKWADPLGHKITVAALEAGIEPSTALRIADCESKMGKYLFNQQGSSAKGIYMFIDSTWENYCEGEVLNEDDNIACFMKLYKTKSHWWQCK